MKNITAMLLASAATASFGHAASAQETDPQTGDGGNNAITVTGRYTLDQQIDTATGLGLSLRETPQSVSVITAQRIIDQDLDTVADVVRNAVGVSMSEVDDVRNTFSARGFEIQNYQVDGVPLAWTLAGGAGETMADVAIYDRVEIVRGATGLLTGAGDPSASINLVRKHASSADWTGYASVAAGSWKNWQIEGDVGGALTDDGRVRVRAVAKYGQGESYIDLFEDKKLVLYGTIEADLGDTTTLRAGMSHQEESPAAPAWGALPSFYADGSFAVWPRSKTASADWAYWDTVNQNIFATLSQDIGENWKLSVNYNYLRHAQTTQILYLFGTLDRTTGEGLFTYPYSDDGQSRQHSVDAQLAGRFNLLGREHDLVVGALHSTQNRENTTFAALAFPSPGDFINWDGTAYPDPGFDSAGSLAVDETVEQTGLYGALRLNLADQLKLIGGGRVASWNMNGFNFGPPRDYGDDNVFIPYVGALYDIAPDHRIYASYTSIFRPQDARDRNGDYLAPVRGNAYEIGLKSAFLGDALQTSIALFRIEQDNLAQADIGYFIPGVNPPAQASFAAKGANSEGFEIEVIGRPANGWNISLGYSQFTARDADGNDVNTDFPRKLLKLFTTYRLARGTLAGLTLGGGVNWQGQSHTDASNPVTGDPFRFAQDGYALVNLMARYEISENLQLQANIENLLDRTYYSQIGFFSQYRYGAPRNFSISAMVSF